MVLLRCNHAASVKLESSTVQPSNNFEATYPIYAIAETNWDAHKSDCSGFVRAVAQAAGVPLGGIANHLVDYWNSEPGWIKLGNDHKMASQMAAQGYLVVAGKKEVGHGHVVVIVPSMEPHGNAMGYWGRLGGIGFKNKALNYAWKHKDLATVQYFATPVATLKARQ